MHTRRLILPLLIAPFILFGCFGNDAQQITTQTTTTSSNQNTAKPVTNTTRSIAPSNTNSTPTATPSSDSTSAPEEDATLTLNAVAQHDSRTDCWLVIEGNVHDVTSFISSHPGGNRILEGCGKDATDLFTGKSALGRVHSALARQTLKKYILGPLQ